MNPTEIWNRENRDIWNRNAEWWDSRTGEGNLFQRVLIGPATERLLAIRPEDWVLDIACGNGAFSRRMAHLGAHVVACDFSETFLARARERTREHADRIEYRLLDATDEAQLLALGERRFDAAVCTMALMDMANIEPLLSALARLLRIGGRFVFSVLHPCFNTTGTRKLAVEEERDGQLRTTYSIQVLRYVHPWTEKGLGILGQPSPHFYFTRPLSVLFNMCFRAGFVMNALEEPAFEEATDETRPFAWENYGEIPPVLIARLVLPPAPGHAPGLFSSAS